jgi:hypothetical protein
MDLEVLEVEEGTWKLRKGPWSPGKDLQVPTRHGSPGKYLEETWKFRIRPRSPRKNLEQLKILHFSLCKYLVATVVGKKLRSNTIALSIKMRERTRQQAISCLLLTTVTGLSTI